MTFLTISDIFLLKFVCVDNRSALTFTLLQMHTSLCTESATYNLYEHFLVLSLLMIYHQVCNQINKTGATSGAGNTYPSVTPEYTPGFQWGTCYSIFSSMCMFCRSLFVLLSFFFWPLCCLPFYDLPIPITLLVSSTSSCK